MMVFRWGRDKLTVLYLKIQEIPHAGDLSICLVKEVKHPGEGRRIVNLVDNRLRSCIKTKILITNTLGFFKMIYLKLSELKSVYTWDFDSQGYTEKP